MTGSAERRRRFVRSDHRASVVAPTRLSDSVFGDVVEHGGRHEDGQHGKDGNCAAAPEGAQRGTLDRHGGPLVRGALADVPTTLTVMPASFHGPKDPFPRRPIACRDGPTSGHGSRLTPAEVQGLFAGAGFRWWIAGGWCLDLAVGRQTREHTDTDVSILRPRPAGFRRHVALWDVHVADPPGPDRCIPGRRDPSSMTTCTTCGAAAARVKRGASRSWSRRWTATTGSTGVTGACDAPGSRPVSGRASVPAMAALAPEIQLLYKSTSLRDKDRADFERVAPLLSEDERGWLERALAMSARITRGCPGSAERAPGLSCGRYGSTADAPRPDHRSAGDREVDHGRGRRPRPGRARARSRLGDERPAAPPRDPGGVRHHGTAGAPWRRVVAALGAGALAQLRLGSSVVLDGVARDPEVEGTRLVAHEEGAGSLVVMTSCGDAAVHRRTRRGPAAPDPELVRARLGPRRAAEVVGSSRRRRSRPRGGRPVRAERRAVAHAHRIEVLTEAARREPPTRSGTLAACSSA